MNELITVNYDNEQPTVSARELHEFLEVGADFRHWFPRMCEYGFEEGKDFRTFLTESSGGRPAQDAEINIDMAKELCMLQRNDKGKQARQYFLQLERDWNSPEKVMAHTSILIYDLAKLIRQNGVDIGGNRLFDWLREHGYLVRRKGTDYNMPTQKSMNMGLFEVKETAITHADGHTSVNRTPKVTGKGQVYFVNKFLGT